MRKATINDVAELAGVSIKTVSRVVNREANVRAATKAKVEKAITDLNYSPNQAARNLASQSARLIGLIYDDPSLYEIPSSGYVIRMQRGTLRACRAANYELLIHPCNFRDRNVGDEIKALLVQARPSGIVLAAPLSNMPKVYRAIEANGTPYIGLSSGRTSGKHLSVATNDREVCAEMTAYLASLGHKDIAFIKGHPNHKAVTNRFLGYQDGLQQAGLKYSERLVCEGDNSFGSGEECALKILKRKRRPTAIFAANDDMAAAALRIADRLHIKVPEQLSIAGFDDISLARQVHPRLTTIRQPLAAMAEHAASMLISGESKSVTRGRTDIVPATLEIRGSTAKPAK
jgi:LacI family transcriptional regulator